MGNEIACFQVVGAAPVVFPGAVVSSQKSSTFHCDDRSAPSTTRWLILYFCSPAGSETVTDALPSLSLVTGADTALPPASLYSKRVGPDVASWAPRVKLAVFDAAGSAVVSVGEVRSTLTTSRRQSDASPALSTARVSTSWTPSVENCTVLPDGPWPTSSPIRHCM